jgi:penicillin-binding protein 2
MNESIEPAGGTSLPTIALRIVVVLVFTGLAVQLWRLQIVEGRDYRRRAEENHIREVRLSAPRGVVYDRQHLEGRARILASNSPIFVLSVIPAELPKNGADEVIEQVAGLLGMSSHEIRQKIDKQRTESDAFTPVPIKYNLDRSAALRLDQARMELPGVSLSVESTRRYAEGALFSHLLGYTALISPTLLPPDRYKRLTSPEGGYSINDRIGADGLEEKYEPVLRGYFGRKKLEVEASGRQRELGLAESPRPGSNLVLTLDLDLQRFVDTALREGLRQSPSGVAVVTDPRNGEILALVSQPGYDNNIFTDESRDHELATLLRDTNKPFFNRAVSGLYPPGSTFKLVTGIAALQEGVASRETIIDSRGAIYFDNDRYPGANASQRLPEWTSAGLGRLNFVGAIANSSNIYFFILGGGYEKDFPLGPLRLGLGNDRLARYARMFGYGAPTGIDLVDEANGTIPDEAWKVARLGESWFKGDTYNVSIGQGFVQATPLQVANVTSTIANGGTLYRPHLLRAVVDADGRVTRLIEPQVVRTVDVASEHLRLIRESMEAGFSNGALLPPYRIPGLRVAGKTGTGEFAGEVNAQGELPTHGWFTGFAPADDPQIAVTVFVDRGSGTQDAAPIAMRIFRAYFNIPEDLQPPPTPTLTNGPQLRQPAPTARPTASLRAAATPEAAVPAETPIVEGQSEGDPPEAVPTRSRRQTTAKASRPTPAPAPAQATAVPTATPHAPRPTTTPGPASTATPTP